MATESSVVTSGVEADRRSFKWKIKNFGIVRRSRAFVEAQKFQFSLGESIGLLTSWSCSLGVSSEDKSIGIDFELLDVDKPEIVDEVNISFRVTIKRTDGRRGKDFFKYWDSVTLHPIKSLDEQSSWGFGGILIPANSKKILPLVQGCLVIDIDFILYAAKQEPEVSPSPDFCWKLETFKTKSLEQLSKDLSQTDTLASLGANLVTKIFSKDGIEFPANRGILSARSPVFQRMFDTKMKEAETGEVRIDDLSGKTLKVLLGYIYTGILHKNWNESEDVVQELTYAAHKYDLGLLTEFLDDTFGREYKHGNNKAKSIWQRIWGRRRGK